MEAGSTTRRYNGLAVAGGISTKTTTKHMNLKEIGEGYLNLAREKLGIAPASVVTLAEKRLALCLACPVYDNGWCASSQGGCGCLMVAAVRSSTKSCPLAKW